MPGGWEATLSSRSKLVVERSASRKCFHPTRCLPRLPDRLSVLFSPRAMSGKRCQRPSREPSSVLSVGSCPHLPLLSMSESRSCSGRCDGWMWQVERFAAPGPLIGASNALRCFHWLASPRAFRLHPAPLVLCVRITAGVGKIGSHATLGRDHLNCASQLLAFPHPSPATSKGETGKRRSFFSKVSPPL
jgi:hypothetical protein